VIICRGKPAVLRSICDRLRQQRGVLHGALSMSSTGSRLLAARGEEER
jgi:metal-responsive CopG/Arc/MetJ family transcriptional regulator